MIDTQRSAAQQTQNAVDDVPLARGAARSAARLAAPATRVRILSLSQLYSYSYTICPTLQRLVIQEKKNISDLERFREKLFLALM